MTAFCFNFALLNYGNMICEYTQISLCHVASQQELWEGKVWMMVGGMKVWLTCVIHLKLTEIKEELQQTVMGSRGQRAFPLFGSNDTD